MRKQCLLPQTKHDILTAINALLVPNPELHKLVDRVPECKLVNSPYTMHMKVCMASTGGEARDRFANCAATWRARKAGHTPETPAQRGLDRFYGEE